MKSPRDLARTSPTRRRVAAADWTALAIAALGLVLRLGNIRAFWNSADEGIYYHIAHAPAEIANALIFGNAHPPLFYYALRAVGSFTDEFVWLRVPAVLFGTLSILALYWVGKRIGGALCGLVAAGVLAVSPGAITLSQVARPYALGLLLLIGATGALIEYAESRRRGCLVVYVTCLLAATLTHYSSFLVVTGFGISLAFGALAGSFDRTELRDLAIAHLPVLLVCGMLFVLHVEPAMLDSAMRREALGSWLGDYFVVAPAALWRNFLGVFDFLAGAALAGVGSIVFLISIAACLQTKRFALVGICLSIVFVAVAASAISVYPFGATRHSAYLAPFLALPIGVASALAFSMGPRAAVGSLFLLAAIVVARGPLAQAIGVVPQPPAEEPEFEIPLAEVDALRAPLDELRKTPGAVIMDLSTAFTLLPLMRDGAIESPWIQQTRLQHFRWGEREVLVIPYWYMAAGGEAIDAPNHLWAAIRLALRVPALAAAIEGDLRVVSVHGKSIPKSIRSLSHNRAERRAVIAGLHAASHLSLFRLDPTAYQQQLARRVVRDADVGSPGILSVEQASLSSVR